MHRKWSNCVSPHLGYLGRQAGCYVSQKCSMMSLDGSKAKVYAIGIDLTPVCRQELVTALY